MPRWPDERLALDRYPGPGFDLTVFYNDLDTNGHINNVALGRYFEQGRFAGNIAAGLRDAQHSTASHFLVGRVAIDYLSEGTYGHVLHVRTRAGRLGGSSVTLEQAAWQDGRVVGLAEVVLVHLIENRPAPLTDPIRAAFARMSVA
jgi:acyl-CoA thioester hydrolase